MPQRRQAIVIDPQDNVATAIDDLQAGVQVTVVDGEVVLLSAIPYGHKFALVDIPSGEYVVKYGAPIGRATAFIPKGSHVHIHNVQDIVDEVRRGG
jgi:altronate dehydratase